MTVFRFCVFLVLLTVHLFEVASSAEDYDAVMERLKIQKMEIEMLKNNQNIGQTRMKKLENKNAELRKSLDAAVGVWTDAKQMTAETTFLATISEYSVSVTPGEAIIWNVAPINPGGHFNTILGMYTAPMHGYYTFSVNKSGNQYQGSFYFLVDEVRYANKDLYVGSDINTSGSATITIELMAEQIVRVENYGSTVIFGTSDDDGEMYSWFTGHLLYAL